MKNVLIITYYWPPMGGGGVQRWLKTSKYLKNNSDWNPIIFTVKNAETSIYDNILGKIPMVNGKLCLITLVPLKQLMAFIKPQYVKMRSRLK
mgnify:CR=1 FL=1